MGKLNLMKASYQWMSRPPDERFGSVAELRAYLDGRDARAAEAETTFGDLSLRAGNGNLQLVSGESGNLADLTDWSFGQVCARIGAPKNYLQTLPSGKVEDLVNYGIKKVVDDLDVESRRRPLVMLVDRREAVHDERGGLDPTLEKRPVLVRAFLTDRYSRVWDSKIAARLEGLLDYGWKVPPAYPMSPDQPGIRKATEADVLDASGFGLSVRVGDDIAPAGLYASDRDLFAFMVNLDRRVKDGSDLGLSRGFFIENSEVGKTGIRILSFLQRHVCGNHIVWDASNVRSLSIRHVGDGPDKFWKEFSVKLEEWSNSTAAEDEAIIATASEKRIAGSEDDVIDAVFRALRGDATKRQVRDAYQLAEEADEKPETVYGMVNGLTRLSQTLPYAEARSKVDKAAGKVLRYRF